jgi:hypothetical protein
MKTLSEVLSHKGHKERRDKLSDSLRSLCSLWLIILSAFAAGPASAQIQQAWVAKYNNGITNGNHQALKMTLDSSGNIYVLGVSQNANTNTGYVTIKYAPNGNPLWTVRYDSTNYPSATPYGFALDSSNAVAVTGNAVTAKYDANGSQLWIAPYNAQAIAVDGGQNIYVTGVSSNFTTMKLSPVGSNLWTTTWGPYGNPNLSQVIAVDSSSNIYLAGMVTIPEIPYPFVQVGTIKYDSNGNVLWQDITQEAGDPGTVTVVGFAIDSSDNVYLEANFYGPSGQFQTYQYNNDGSPGWSVSNPTGNLWSLASCLTIDKATNVLVTGQAPSNFTSDNSPLFSYATFKFDTNGSVLWRAEYPIVSTSTNVGTSITVDQNNNVYVTGYSQALGTNLNSDIVTIKYDSNGRGGPLILDHR